MLLIREREREGYILYIICSCEASIETGLQTQSDIVHDIERANGSAVETKGLMDTVQLQLQEKEQHKLMVTIYSLTIALMLPIG